MTPFLQAKLAEALGLAIKPPWLLKIQSAPAYARGDTLRSKDRDTWPAALKDLRVRFEAGDVPTMSLKMMDKARQIGKCRVCTL